jgi:hypothetical protein
MAFARPVGLPFLLADDAVTVGVQLVEQLAVTAFPFSFLRMQSPCEAQHGNDSNGNDFHTVFFCVVVLPDWRLQDSIPR